MWNAIQNSYVENRNANKGRIINDVGTWPDQVPFSENLLWICEKKGCFCKSSSNHNTVCAVCVIYCMRSGHTTIFQIPMAVLIDQIYNYYLWDGHLANAASQGSFWVWGWYDRFCVKAACHKNGMKTINQKALKRLFSNLAHTLVVIMPRVWIQQCMFV